MKLRMFISVALVSFLLSFGFGSAEEVRGDSITNKWINYDISIVSPINLTKNDSVLDLNDDLSSNDTAESKESKDLPQSTENNTGKSKVLLWIISMLISFLASISIAVLVFLLKPFIGKNKSI